MKLKYKFHLAIAAFIFFQSFFCGPVSAHAARLDIEEIYPFDVIEKGIKKEITSEILFDRSRADNNDTLADDSVPAGAKEILPVKFDSAVSFSGSKSIALRSAGREISYFVDPHSAYFISTNENIVFYVKTPAADPAPSFMIAFYDETGSGEHRAYFGDINIDFGGMPGTFSRFDAGAFAVEPGIWHRAVIPAAALELGGHKICGVLLAKTSGTVFIDKITRSEAITDPQKFRFEKVENILTVYKNSFVHLVLKAPGAAAFSEGELTLAHSCGKKYSKKLKSGTGGEFTFDLTDRHGEVIPSGRASFTLDYKTVSGASASAGTDYDILQLIANIQLPWKNSIVNATVPVFGDALGMDFSHYSISAINLSRAGTEEITIATSREPKFLINRSLSFGGKATVMGNLASFNAGTNFGYKYDRSKKASSMAYNGPYRIVLKVYDKKGNMRHASRDIIIGRLISNTCEQFVESADGLAALIVQPYSITEGFTLCSLVEKPGFLSVERPEFKNEGFEPISPVYEARPRGLKFDLPASLKITVPGHKLDTGSVSIFQYRSAAGWMMLETSVEAEGLLSAPVAGFNDTGKTFFAAFSGDTVKFANLKAEMTAKIPRHKASSPPIEVSSESHPFLVQCDFEDGACILTPRSIQNNVEIALDKSTKAAGESSAKITNKTCPSDIAVNIYPRPYDASKFPVLSFSYRCPATVEVNIMLKALGRYFEIPLSSPTAGSSIGHVCLGAQNFIRDDSWHSLTVNIFEMIKNVSPQLKENEPLTVEEIFFCDFDYEGWAEVSDGRNPAGAAFYIDDLIITSGGSASKTIKFSWKSNRPDIKKFSFAIDGDPFGIPGPEISSAASASFTVEGSGGGDMRYLHITGHGEDSAPLTGVSHLRVKVDNTPPRVVSTSPQNGSSSASSIITAVIDDFDGSGVAADGLKCEVDGYVYCAGDGALTYDSGKKLMQIEPFKKIPAPPGFMDGQNVSVRIFDVRDNAGNVMKEPYTFVFKADYSSMTAGRDSLVTTGGGSAPCFTPDSASIIYVSAAANKTALYAVDVSGKNRRKVSPDASADYRDPFVLSSGDIIACKKTQDAGNFFLVKIPAGGGPEQKLCEMPGCDILRPSAPENPAMLYFSAGNDIYSFDVKTSRAKKILSDPNAFMVEPSISPDGKMLAFRKDLYSNTLWISSGAGENMRAITLDGQEFNPCFAADGASVLFTKAENGVSSICSVNIDGSRLEPVIPAAVYGVRNPAASPDKKMIAYESARNGLWNISVFRLIYAAPAEPQIIAEGGQGKEKPAARLDYEISSDDTAVSVKIYDHQNKLVRVLAEDKKEFAGLRSLIWDGRDGENKPADQSKPYIVKYEFKSANSAAPLVKVSRVDFSEAARRTAIDYSELRAEVRREEEKRKSVEADKIARIKEDVKKGGDDVPPAPVNAFRAKPAVAKIELSWNKNGEKDLAGYKIIRTQSGRKEAGVYKIGPEKASYVDLAAESGKTYTYSISAFDSYDNFSAPREVTATAEFDYQYFALPYAGKPHIIKLNLNELALELYESAGGGPALRSSIVAPENIAGGIFSFACHEGGYTLYCLNPASGELYYSRSPGLKSFSGWELVSAEFYAPPDASEKSAISFICPKDSKTVKAVCFDSESDTLYEGDIKKNSSKISWKVLSKGFIGPPEEVLSYSLDFAGGKYKLYAVNRSSGAVYSCETSNFKVFSSWREE
ncbi:MAG TPA: hypothetical protein PK467_02245, partial [Candidatus Wallbacteria bacterium]|nr:hypothetical protein [Candidatus Wallbacteria bacterium]